MHFEVSFGCETVSADVTFKGPFASVWAQVDLESAVISKCLPTELAFVLEHMFTRAILDSDTAGSLFFAFLEESTLAARVLKGLCNPMTPGDWGRSVGSRLAKSGSPFKSAFKGTEPKPPVRDVGMVADWGSFACFKASKDKFWEPIRLPMRAAAAESCCDRCAPSAFSGSTAAPSAEWKLWGVIMATWRRICSVSWICCSCCCWRLTSCSRIMGIARRASWCGCGGGDFCLDKLDECCVTATLVAAMDSRVTLESCNLEDAMYPTSELPDTSWSWFEGSSLFSMSSPSIISSESALCFECELLVDWSPLSPRKSPGECWENSGGTSFPSPSFMITTCWLLVQFLSCSRNSASSKNSPQHLSQTLVSSDRRLLASLPSSSPWPLCMIPAAKRQSSRGLIIQDQRIMCCKYGTNSR